MTETPMFIREERLGEKFSLKEWLQFRDLFGDTGCDMNDFEMSNYIYFLDNVKSLENLVRGLNALSPFADDALRVVEGMNEEDFCEFKLTLAHERRLYECESAESLMPAIYHSILIPARFIQASIVAKQSVVPLGAALIRIIEEEEKELE